MKRIVSNKITAAIGPYVHATISSNLVITSGQIGIDVASGKLGETFVEQAKLALKNLQTLVEDSGSDLAHVLKCTVYLTDMTNFAEFNGLYQTAFGDNYPARTAIAIAELPMKSQIEIEAIAELK